MKTSFNYILNLMNDDLNELEIEIELLSSYKYDILYLISKQAESWWLDLVYRSPLSYRTDRRRRRCLSRL